MDQAHYSSQLTLVLYNDIRLENSKIQQLFKIKLFKSSIGRYLQIGVLVNICIC